MITYTQNLQIAFNKAMLDISTNQYYCILLDSTNVLRHFKDIWTYTDFLSVVEGTFIRIKSLDTSEIKYVEGTMTSSFSNLFTQPSLL